MNSEEIKEKILLRLNLIIKLKKLLLVYLPAMSLFKPPIAVFGLDVSNEVPFIDEEKNTNNNSNKKN
jgi:hypothetical protein